MAWERKRLRINVEMDTVTVLSDSFLLSIVRDNLISDAVKFTPEGGSVYVSVKTSSSYASVTVSDTDLDFDEATGKRISDKFYKGSQKRKRKATASGSPQ